MPSVLLDWGVQLVLRFQAVGDWLIEPMNFLTFTGDIEFYLLFLPVLYWTVNRRLALRVTILLLLSIVIGSLGKIFFHAPRPYWYDPQVQLLTAPEFSFGIPSSHAQNAVVLWGFFAYYGRRTWGWIGALLLAGLTGISRIYLGVHFPTDVLAGWLLGVFVLWGGIWGGDTLAARLKAHAPARQFSFFWLVSVGLTAAALGLSSLVQGTWSLPLAWVETALATAGVAPAPFSLENVVTAAGALFGLTAGALLCTLGGGFDMDAAWKARLLRCLVGLVGVLVLWRGLDLLFVALAPDESALGYLLRYVRYTAIGLWVAALAPWLFIRLKLAKPEALRV